MRHLLICLAGALLMLSAPAFAAGPALSRSDAPPVAVQKPIEQVRMVTRCRVVRVWRHGPRGRHLVPVRRCHRVWVR